MLKTIAIKLAFLLAVFLLLNIVYSHTLFPSDLEKTCKEVLDIHKTQENTDIYYFGESSNIAYRQGDSITNTISEITNKFFPKLKITAINKPGTHAGIYKRWLKQLDGSKKSPKALVVTLNLRSFDATWINSTLEPSLQQSMVFTYALPNLMNRFLLSLQAFDNRTNEQRDREIKKQWTEKTLTFPQPFQYKTLKEWDDGLASIKYTKPDGSRDLEKNLLPCHYVKAYAFDLDEQNIRVRDFDEIAAWCNKNQIRLYLNLMAENVEYADSLVGKELVFLMRKNRDYLVARYSSNNCLVIDNLEAVKGSEFIDQNWTTEHYAQKGRMIIAKKLALALKKQFENNFITAY